MDGVAIAEKVLELAENEEYEKILNLGAATDQESIPIGKTSTPAPFSLLRKLYLKLSLVIHPDKLGKQYPNATRAFQALVKAFEALSNPTPIGLDSTDTKKGRGKAQEESPLQISRSNENCFRTRVACPRCKQPWNEGTLDGNPDFSYNLLMIGLKQYSCSTCLCEFGCMTAIHYCPFCSKIFEYSPHYYHQQITCPNPSCAKKFGFYLYHISDRRLKEIKQLIKDELLQKQKIRENKQRRAERQQNRSTSSLTQHEKEKAFTMGLADICPRCGEFFEEFENEDLLRQHLMECLDSVKHATFQKKIAKEKEKQEKKAAKQLKQENAEILASWQFFGGQTSQLWLLNEEHLKEQAKGKGLSTIGDKDDLIHRLLQHDKKVRGDGDGDEEEEAPALIEEDKNQSSTRKKRKSEEVINLLEDTPSHDGDDDDGAHDANALIVLDKSSIEDKKNNHQVVVRKKKKKMNVDDIPSNLHTLSVAQLRSLCVANGLKAFIPKNAKKSDLIELIEEEIFQE